MNYPGYPDWTVETTHPVAENSADDYCAFCYSMIEPALLFAVDWGSVAHGNEIIDEQGTKHTVVVRYVDPAP